MRKIYIDRPSSDADRAGRPDSGQGHRIGADSRGSTLIPIILMVGMISAGMLASSSYFSSTIKQQSYTRTLASRDQLERSLLQLASVGTALQKSVAVAASGTFGSNMMSWATGCLQGPPSGVLCYEPEKVGVSLTGHREGFAMFSPIPSSGGAGNTQISGRWNADDTISNPIYYQVDGKLCTEAKAQNPALCPILVASRLEGSCHGVPGYAGVDDCTPTGGYTSIRLRYTIRQRAEVNGLSAGGTVTGQLATRTRNVEFQPCLLTTAGCTP